MNQLKGIITEIKSCEGLSLIKVKTTNNVVFSSMMLTEAKAVDWLAEGKRVNLLFKEIEVMISKDADLSISVQNRIPCVVGSVKTGEILAQVELLFNETSISSIVTANACRQLDLKVNDGVTALVKTNEISLSPDD